jgi:hypothetical protein
MDVSRDQEQVLIHTVHRGKTSATLCATTQTSSLAAWAGKGLVTSKFGRVDCLSQVSHDEDDSMCYVYHEKEKKWYLWGSCQLMLCCSVLRRSPLSETSMFKSISFPRPLETARCHLWWFIVLNDVILSISIYKFVFLMQSHLRWHMVFNVQ